MKIAIVADWLPTFGGAEHVVASLTKLYPDAPIFTTVANRSKIGPLAHADIRTSHLQEWYRLLGRHQYLLPWMPRAVERFDLSEFDVILSSSHAVAKGVIPGSRSVHVCYCHTPMRYAWEMEEEYLADFKISGLLKKFAKKQLKKIRRFDMTTAQRTDVFIANSSETALRIKRIYNLESQVVHPPVEEKFFEAQLSSDVKDRSYYLAVGRFVPYKRFDLLIEAANANKLPLKIIGRGDDAARLKKMAGPTVEFLGFVADQDLPAWYGGAKAVLFPQLEDAGVVPLEAQACGTPVIAFGQGGALDTVKDPQTGVFFAEQTLPSLLDAIVRSEQIDFDPHAIREHARQFAESHFLADIAHIVEQAYKEYRTL